MKFVLILAVVSTIASASPVPQAQPQQVVQILKSENSVGQDSYNYAYELTDGSAASQSGVIKNPQEPDPEQRILAVTGEFRYTAQNGQPVQVIYTADENGYKPTYISSAQ